jgi:hypothetical protein
MNPSGDGLAVQEAVSCGAGEDSLAATSSYQCHLMVLETTAAKSRSSGESPSFLICVTQELFDARGSDS